MAFVPRLTIPESGNPYYNTVSVGGYSGAIKGYPMVTGLNVLANCVGYATGRFNEIIGANKMMYLMYPPNAEDFIAAAKAQGLKTGSEPKLGSIIVWAKGEVGNSADGAGHVAVVEEIHTDGSITTSESGYGCANPFWTSKRTKGGNWGAGNEWRFLGFVYQPNDPAPTVIFIKKGDKGPAVTEMQTKLYERGYLRKNEIDGDFGKITLGAVCAFQLENGLIVDGICGPQTSALLGM